MTPATSIGPQTITPGPLPPGPAAVIAAYRDGRLTLAQCAARFGVTTRTVTTILEAHHIPRRPPGHPTPLHDPATLAAFLAAYRDHGLPLELCARRYGVSYGAARRALLANGIRIGPPRHLPILTPAQQADLITAYHDQQLSLSQCAARFYISPTTVRRILLAHSIDRRPAGPLASPHPGAQPGTNGSNQ